MTQLQLKSLEYSQEQNLWNLDGLLEGKEVYVVNGKKVLYYASKDQMQGPWQGEVLQNVGEILHQYYLMTGKAVPYTSCKKFVCFSINEKGR